ncbi:MAG TPA: ArsR family transcriptional regulator [Lacunisphaera sp.]|nr:ArsR family transcriptional regulator [Lacunisphaera sp.]
MVRPTSSQPSLPPAERGLVNVGNRPADLVDFEAAVVNFFVDAAELLGVPKSVAAIYGIVFASVEPLCFADIEQRLNLSRGTISQSLRVLREIGAIKEVSRATDRAELFTPDLELRKLIERFLATRLETQLAAGGKQLADISRRVPAGDPARAAVFNQRLKLLGRWNKRTRALVPIARAFLHIPR